MLSNRPLEKSIEQLGVTLLDSQDVKAVMMSKDEAGNVMITLVEGTETSHKVKFGRVERRSRSLVRSISCHS